MPAEMIKRGRDEWNQWRKSLGQAGSINLVGLSLARMDFRLYDLREVFFDESDLTASNFVEAVLTSSSLRGVNAPNANFTRAQIVGREMGGGIFDGANFTDANLDSCHAKGASFKLANLSGTCFRGSDAEEGNFRETILREVDFESANLSRADFTNARFIRCNLRHTRFDGVVLAGAELCDCTVDVGTSFRGADVTGFAVDDPHFFNHLENFGGLTKSDRRVMVLKDPVTQLRKLYTGFFGAIQTVALVAFLFPYVWFLFHTWVESHFKLAPFLPSSIPLREAFARFVWNGGDRWREGWFFSAAAFVPFCFAVFYNSARAILIWKTKELEQHERLTGLPAAFDLQERPWKQLYKVAKFGFWLNIGLVLVHTWHFLALPVPVFR
jgi:uncharacterized protein YjbI with pentapeptide repeats